MNSEMNTPHYPHQARIKPGTPEERKLAARRYKAGETIEAIALDMGCRAPKTVRGWLRSEGVPLRQRHAPSEEQVAQARRMYVEEGQSLKAVARALGFNSATIRKYLCNAGVHIRGHA